MDKKQYLELMNLRLKSYFELEKEFDVVNKRIDLYGKYQMLLGRTFLSQKGIIDKFETNEYILIKCIDKLTEEDLKEYIDYLNEVSKVLVKPHSYHKSTYINMVIVCDGKIACNKQAIRKFKNEKVYSFYLKGFSEIRLIVVDLRGDTLITNKAAKHVKEAYEPFYKK